MRKCKLLFSFLLIFLNYIAHGAVEKEYEEVPFDTIVEDLNQHIKQKTKYNINEESSDPFDRMTIYTSFGLLQTINFFQFDNETKSRFREGINIGVGVDLFNPNWIAEANIKNYGKSTKPNEVFSLREFDLRLSYRELKANNISYKFVQGLGARYLRFQNLEVQKNYKEQTPIYLLGVSLDSQISKQFSLGFELSGTTALISETVDRNSINLNFKMDNYF